MTLYLPAGFDEVAVACGGGISRRIGIKDSEQIFSSLGIVRSGTEGECSLSGPNNPFVDAPPLWLTAPPHGNSGEVELLASLCSPDDENSSCVRSFCRVLKLQIFRGKCTLDPFGDGTARVSNGLEVVNVKW